MSPRTFERSGCAALAAFHWQCTSSCSSGVSSLSSSCIGTLRGRSRSSHNRNRPTCGSTRVASAVLIANWTRQKAAIFPTRRSSHGLPRNALPRRGHGYVESVTAGAGLEARVAIVGAPLAGGPSTPALAAAVSEAGGLGFLAAGYKTAAAVQAELHALRALTSEPIGLNVFYPTRDRVDERGAARRMSSGCEAKSSGTAWWSASRAGRTTIGRPSSRSRRASDRMSFRSRSAARSVRSSSGSKAAAAVSGAR